MSDEPRGGLDAVPGLVRLTASAWLHTAEWALSTSLRAGSRLLHAAASGESTTDFLSETQADVRGYARRLLGIASSSNGHEPVSAVPAERDELVSLRDRGEELLRRSADLDDDEPAHPAYERILDELAPDEARILRFLRSAGPQPAVDVRSSRTLNVNSHLVAPGLSMIGEHAGCRFQDRVPAYLNNLNRLGLIWFSRESLEDPLRYQVLEVQPDVVAALHGGGGRARTIRRSIHLTPFGDDFCEVCLGA
jgi:hypothetical protein